MKLLDEIRSRGGLPFLSLVAILLVALILAQEEPKEPDFAGNYQTFCCGSFDLANNAILVAGQSVSLTLKRDKLGWYAVPDKLVAVSKGSIIISERNPLMLRFDDKTFPTSIEIPRDDGTGFVRFERQLVKTE